MKYFSNLSILLLLFVQCATIYAQSSIIASGGNASGSAGTVSFTIGQFSYLNYSGTMGIITEGIQQPYEISVITGFEEIPNIPEMSVYPNPTDGFIILKIKNSETSKLKYNYRLFDFNGNLKQRRSLDDDQTEILLESFKPGTYFLKIFKNNHELKAFKIIKK